MGIRWSYFAIPGFSFKSEQLSTDQKVAAPIIDVPRVATGLKDRMQVRGNVVMLLVVFWSLVLQVLRVYLKGEHLALDVLGFAVPLAVALRLASRWNLRERWKSWQKQARSMNYLMCHNCGQDLRQCKVRGKDHPVPPPWQAQEFDTVECPKCQSRHSVPDLLGVWDT